MKITRGFKDSLLVTFNNGMTNNRQNIDLKDVAVEVNKYGDLEFTFANKQRTFLCNFDRELIKAFDELMAREKNTNYNFHGFLPGKSKLRIKESPYVKCNVSFDEIIYAQENEEEKYCDDDDYVTPEKQPDKYDIQVVLKISNYKNDYYAKFVPKFFKKK